MKLSTKIVIILASIALLSIGGYYAYQYRTQIKNVGASFESNLWKKSGNNLKPVNDSWGVEATSVSSTNANIGTAIIDQLNANKVFVTMMMTSTGDIIPGLDNAYNLGTSSLAWKEVRAHNIYGDYLCSAGPGMCTGITSTISGLNIVPEYAPTTRTLVWSTTGGPIYFGNTTTPVSVYWGSSGPDDVVVGDSLYTIGRIGAQLGMFLQTNAGFTFGNYSEGIMSYNSYPTGVSHYIWGARGSNTVEILNRDNWSNDYLITNESDPTLSLRSNAPSASSTVEAMKLSYSTANKYGLIRTLSGGIALSPSGTIVMQAVPTGVQLLSGLYDSTNATGTSGQLLSSTGTSTKWITQTAAGSVGSAGYIQFASSTAGAFNATSGLFWDNTNGRLGVGINVPSAALDVRGALANPPSYPYNAIFSDTASYATGVGGGLAFGGKYNSAGNFGGLAVIKGGKENAIDGDYAGYLSFYSRPNGAALTERMRITSVGNVGIGTSTPGAQLQVHGQTGVNPSIWLSGSEFTHPFTAVGFNPEINSKVSGLFGQASRLGGGFGVSGFTSAAATNYTALNFVGYQGSTAPTAPNIAFYSFKTDGTTGRAALANTEIASQWLNGTTPIMTILGGGNVGIGTTAPSSTLSTYTTTGAAGIKLVNFDASESGGMNLSDGATSGFLPIITGQSYGVTGYGFGINGVMSLANDLDTPAGGGFIMRAYRTDGTNNTALQNANVLSLNNYLTNVMTVKANGYVGIGTSTPNSLLQVVGNINATTFNNATLSEITTAGEQNLDIGYQAGGTFVSGMHQNTFIGYQSGTGGTHTNATDANTAVGHVTLNKLTTGGGNNAFGIQAGYNITTGGNNTAIGENSLYSNQTTNSNVALGGSALLLLTGGGDNVSVGRESMSNVAYGKSNVAVGRYAGTYYGLTGTFNTIASSSNGIYIGHRARAMADAQTNEIVLGYEATGNGSNSVTLGNDSIIKTILKGNVGIGTTSPAYTLSVSGTISMTGNMILTNTTNASKNGIVYKGASTFLHDFNYGNNGSYTTEGHNLFLGTGAGNLTMGSTAGATVQSSYNIGIGDSALSGNTTGYHNIAVGYTALTGNTTGKWNIAIGDNSLNENTTGASNIAIGNDALTAATAGISNNIAIGTDAAKALNNSSISLVSNNTIVGTAAMVLSTIGANNTAIGMESLYNSGSGGVAGHNNVALGFRAGKFIADGSTALTAVSSSVFIGSGVKSMENNSYNEIVIGANAIGNGSNSVTLGSTSTLKTILQGDVGIGTTTPGYKFQVYIDASNEGHVAADGTWANSSDVRLKKNISTMTNGLSTLQSLRPIYYDSISNSGNSGNSNLGFAAQELELILPQVVDTNPITGYKSVSYAKLTPVLAAAIKEQQSQIDALTIGLAAVNPSSTQLLSIATPAITSFDSKITFNNHVVFGEDTVGQAKIKVGATSTYIGFKEVYENLPVITVTPLDFVSGTYRVLSTSTGGFAIEVTQSQENDLSFNWHAFDSVALKSHNSDGTVTTVSIVIAPDGTMSTPSSTVTDDLAGSDGVGSGDLIPAVSADDFSSTISDGSTTTSTDSGTTTSTPTTDVASSTPEVVPVDTSVPAETEVVTTPTVPTTETTPPVESPPVTETTPVTP